MSIGRLVIKIIRSGGEQQATLPITAGYFSRVSRPFAIYDRVENLARPVSKAELAGATARNSEIGSARNEKRRRSSSASLGLDPPA